MDEAMLPAPSGQQQGVTGSANIDSNGDAIRALAQARLARARRKEKRRRNPGLKKKLAFVTHLLKSLDLLVFTQLSALYYMECSIFRLCLRAAGQYIYLSPKDEAFPFIMPASRIHVLFVVIPNSICFLLHLFASLPIGPDYHRGYQHGGLIIDFVGQKPATSRLYYLLVDVFILAIQCLMLTIHSDRENLRQRLRTFKPLVPNMLEEVTAGRTLDDLDAEERGVSVEDDGGLGLNGNSEDVELQPLNPPGSSDTRTRDGTQDDDNDENATRTYLSDIMISGNGMLGEYHVLHTMKFAAMHINRTASQSFQSLGYRATMAALQARQRGGAAI